MSTTAVAVSAADRVAWPHIRELAAIEARRYARRASIWAGWAATVLSAAMQHPDWSGGSYAWVIPLSFGFMILGVFVAGARSGSADTDRDLPPLAEEAAVDGGDRLAARILGLVMPVALTMLTTIGMAVVSRIEGGFWMGEGPTRTDSAVHSVLELLQPALLVALAGALGVVVGRTTHHTILVIIVGVFVWMVLFPFYWVWNAPPLHVVTPIQIMPLWVELADVRSMTDLPADWYVEYPNEFEPHYRRALVHPPTVAFHHVYLVGLIMVVAASVGRDRRRTVRRVGIAMAIAGVAAQLTVSPF